MIEIGLLIAACVGMGKVADADGRSAMIWGIITLVVGLASLAIPLPLLRVLLACVVVFIIMMVSKAMSGR